MLISQSGLYSMQPHKDYAFHTATLTSNIKMAEIPYIITIWFQWIIAQKVSTWTSFHKYFDENLMQHRRAVNSGVNEGFCSIIILLIN